MNKIVLYIATALLLIGLGFGIATWRTRNRIAGYDNRERERIEKVAANEAEQNRLRGENEVLRKHVAELMASEEGLKTIIERRGGVIADEAKNLEKINENLKTNLAVVSAPGDKCIRCRAYSDELLRAGQIGKPLTCKDECASAAR